MPRQTIRQQRDMGPKHHRTDPEPTPRETVATVLAYVLLMALMAAVIVAIAGWIWT